MVGSGHLNIREFNMKKSNIVKRIIIAVLFAAVLLSTPLLFLIKTPEEKNTQKWSSTIEINERVLSPVSNSIDFKVDKEGEHTLYFSLIPDGFDKDSVGEVKLSDLGFITTFVVTDSNDNVVYSSTQGAIYLDTVIYLMPGNYKVTYYYFSDPDEFYDFESTNIVSIKEATQMVKDINFPSFNENGTTVFNYEFCCLSKDETLVFPAIMIGWGIALGLLFGLFLAGIVFSGKDGEKKYDERQKIEQGKAFKIGFWTILFTVQALICLNEFWPSIFGENPIFYEIAILLGMVTYVIYCILHESYFAINQKSTGYIIIFAVLALINLVISIVNTIHGQMVVNGVITFRVLNPLCTIVMIVIIVTIFAKRIANSKNASADEEEEDDE